MNDEIEFTGRSWAIVTSGNRRYIGKIERFVFIDPMHRVDAKEDALTYTGITLNPAYEINTITQPVQVGPGQMALRRETLVFPIDCCTQDVRVHIPKVGDIIFAEDLQPSDQRTYVEQIERTRLQMQESRVQKLGIASPPPGFNPGNFRGGPPFGS